MKITKLSTPRHIAQQMDLFISRASGLDRATVIERILAEIKSKGRLFADEIDTVGIKSRNAIGAAFMALSKQRLIRFTGRVRNSNQPSAHGRLVREWEVVA